jgi:hypothetical protein
MRSPMKVTGAALLAAAGLAACSSSNGPSNAGRTVAFQLATRQSAAQAALRADAAGSETIALGNDTIVLTAVQVVLRRIELERVEGTPCDTTVTEDGCEELKAGPVLLDLPLGVGAARSFTVAVDTGSFGKIKFEIHRPESGHDAAFLGQHPDFTGVSIRATGTYNGTAFSYTSDLDVEQEHEFNPPVSVTDTTGANLTLFVDLAGWFANAGGTGLIDPATALSGQPNEGEVKSNIETSFNAFEDENHDGGDDHGGR